MLIPILYILAAIVVLYFGADMTLEAAEKVGKKLGFSPLVIGMLLVGFGTSLPEFFVGHIAAAKGESGIAMGSLLGSNIANMFLILGICGIFSKLSVQGKSLREHLFIHLGLGLILIWVLNQPELNLFTSSPLIVLLFIYLYFIYKDMQREKLKKESAILVVDPNAPKDKTNTPLLVFKMNIGFVMLYVGGELLVKGGTELGVQAGIDSYIISSIFIAFGTSFPELVTGLMAALKKKDTDIIIGNIVGSNLFNCAFILGSLGIYEFKIVQTFNFELTALISGALVFILLSFIKRDLYRLTSIIFLMTYGTMVAHWLKII
jgi:cation:H+ antiporter